MRVLLAFCVIFCSAVAVAEEKRSIKVSAMSEIKVVPDEVVLALEIRTRDKQLLVSKINNDKTTANVLSLAEAHSIPADDMKVTNLDLRPDFGEYGRRQIAAIAYDFTRSVEVRLTDFEKIEPFLSDAIHAGVSEVSSMHFRVGNQRKHQLEARKLAVEYAKEKAEHLTELTGMKLGTPIRIEEDVEENSDAGGMAGMGGMSSVIRVPEKVDGLASKQGTATFVSFQEAKDEEREELNAPGQIIIRANVTIEFEMLPK